MAKPRSPNLSRGATQQIKRANQGPEAPRCEPLNRKGIARPELYVNLPFRSTKRDGPVLGGGSSGEPNVAPRAARLPRAVRTSSTQVSRGCPSTLLATGRATRRTSVNRFYIRRDPEDMRLNVKGHAFEVVKSGVNASTLASLTSTSTRVKACTGKNSAPA